jgi:hypothetical protein
VVHIPRIEPNPPAIQLSRAVPKELPVNGDRSPRAACAEIAGEGKFPNYANNGKLREVQRIVGDFYHLDWV